jgi:hypothetical protein
MNTSCCKFLRKEIEKGGKNAYVALLILAALEKNQKELLKRVDLSFVQSNLHLRTCRVTKNNAS